jgi:WD40 repeat protein
MNALLENDKKTAQWSAHINDRPSALTWSPDGRRIAVAAMDGPIHILNAEDGVLFTRLPGHDVGTSSLAWNTDGSALASGGQDGKVRIWDVENGNQAFILDGGGAWVEHVAYNPFGGTARSGHLLASAAGRFVRIWSAKGDLIRSYGPHPSTVAAIAWKPGKQELVTAAYSCLATWIPSQDKPIARFEWKGSILAIACSPNGRYIATGDQDASVHFWITKSGEDLQMSGYPVKVRELAWDSQSRFLATGGSEFITIWNCTKSPAGTRPQQFDFHEALLTTLQYQHRGGLLASGDAAGVAGVWMPTRSDEPLATYQMDGEITHTAWAPNDIFLALASSDGEVRVLTRP